MQNNFWSVIFFSEELEWNNILNNNNKMGILNTLNTEKDSSVKSMVTHLHMTSNLYVNVQYTQSYRIHTYKDTFICTCTQSHLSVLLFLSQIWFYYLFISFKHSFKSLTRGCTLASARRPTYITHTLLICMYQYVSA